MRKREIHSVAHWAMMFLLLMFPLLMVGISTFGKETQTIDVNETYQYQTNDVNSVDDLVVGNIYHVEWQPFVYNDNFNLPYTNAFNFGYDENGGYFSGSFSTYYSTSLNMLMYKNGSYKTFALVSGDVSLVFYSSSTSTNNVIIKFDFLYNNSGASLLTVNTNGFSITASEYLGNQVFDYTINNADYKQEINNWLNEFLDLPINAWYKSLMNVIGVGFTSSTVMNVIYVMPVYILWVFIFDVIVDCFLVIIKLPHKLLNRLSGGENE